MNNDKDTRTRHRFVGLYFLLLGLLGANMVGTLIDAGGLAMPIRLSVAGVMVVVIATSFMRLRESSPLVRLVAVMSLLWIMFLFVLTFADFLTR